MYYYIIKPEDGKEKYFIETDESSMRYISALIDGRIKGKFGRLDYAEIWTDFHNGVIDRDELRKKLDAF